jgi:hypothetical protein
MPLPSFSGQHREPGRRRWWAPYHRQHKGRPTTSSGLMLGFAVFVDSRLVRASPSEVSTCWRCRPTTRCTSSTQRELWASRSVPRADARCSLPEVRTLCADRRLEPREEERNAHASPQEALRIAADLGAKVAIGMHWGTFPLSEEPLFEPPQRFMRARQHKGTRPVVLRMGECPVLD